MINLTAPDGSAITINPKLVVRARRTVYGESGAENPEANTRVDWAETSYVQEPIDRVAELVHGELASFTALTGRDGTRIWFNALQAVGPLALTPSQKVDGINSAIKIMGYRQYVTESPNEVRAVIRAAGGTPL